MSTTASPSDLRCNHLFIGGRRCHERQIEGSIFCARHSDRLKIREEARAAQCRATTKAGRQCRNRPEDGARFCPTHAWPDQSQAGPSSSDPNRRYCAGTTKAGRQCRNRPEDGARFCTTHAWLDQSQAGPAPGTEDPYARGRQWHAWLENMSPQAAGYYRSEKWRRKRWARRERDGHRCVVCGCSKPGQLVVHHITYERFGNEHLEDLRTVCVHCHRNASEADLTQERPIEEYLEEIERTAKRAEGRGTAE